MSATKGAKEYGEPLADFRYPPDRVGQPDHKIKAFDYRLCLTADPANQVPFRRPTNFRPRLIDD